MAKIKEKPKIWFFPNVKFLQWILSCDFKNIFK